MNVFRTIASGKHAFREEFVSAFLAYLISPKMDHGLGFTFLSKLLLHIANINKAPELKMIASQLKSCLWENIFDDNAQLPIVELEFRYASGFIDIVVKYKNWFIAIENKILESSKTENQLLEQYIGIQEVIRNKGFDGHCQILLIYLVPAVKEMESWGVSSSFFAEMDKVNLKIGDQKVLVSWQPITDGETEIVSIVSIIREILKQEADGVTSPISTEVKHALRSLIDFAMGEFQGYYYDGTTSQKDKSPKYRVNDILTMTGNFYVGIQYGRGGLISCAWNNNDFLQAEFAVVNESRGWQYLPLNEFILLTKWCLDHEKFSLKELEWKGAPFFTDNLYRVCKYGCPNIYIGLKGGSITLNKMTPDEISDRKVWQLSSIKKSSSWISSEEYCQILESKGLIYT